jgi:hypothetical protein
LYVPAFLLIVEQLSTENKALEHKGIKFGLKKLSSVLQVTVSHVKGPTCFLQIAEGCTNCSSGMSCVVFIPATIASKVLKHSLQTL